MDGNSRRAGDQAHVAPIIKEHTGRVVVHLIEQRMHGRALNRFTHFFRNRL